MHVSGKVLFGVNKLVDALLSLLLNVVGAHHDIARHRVSPQRPHLLLDARLVWLELSKNARIYRLPLAPF